MSRLLKYLTSQPIANTGSVARDHLANERTFLSWTRTGLGFIALGIALAKLDALEALSLTKNPSLNPNANANANPNPTQNPRPDPSLLNSNSNLNSNSQQNDPTDDLRIPSAALVASGTGCLSYGTTRYFRSLQLLQKGLFRPNVAGVGLVAVTSGAVAGGGVYLLVKEEMRGR